jgi:molecular chaperone Hsp33
MSPDTLHRFLFENAPIRGEIVRLQATWRTVLERHDYPPVLRNAMGELMAAAALLTATLKLKGSLILQIQGNGPLSLLVVECNGDLAMRATAKWNEDLSSGTSDSLAELVGNGRFAITLDPKDGKQTYQGIVPLEGASVAEILQNYMTRSEQLETRLWLAADNECAAGMLLQKLPERPEQNVDAWQHAGHLANTVKAEELLNLPAKTLLHRLFHQEDIRLFDPQPVSFHCRCSREGVANVLRMLGHDEVNSILKEQGNIEVHCEFCNQRYLFDRIDAEQVFATNVITPGSATRH